MDRRGGTVLEWDESKDLIDWRCKGLPAGEETVAVSEIASRAWNLLNEDLMLPVAVLREDALRRNSDWMRRFTEAAGVKLCPHGKTTMSPALFNIQLDDGAWGITAATVGQVRVFRKHGIGRILLANALIGRQDIDYILGALAADPDFDFYALADSIAAVELLEQRVRHRKLDRPLQLLVELGLEGGRSGARSSREAQQVAERIATSPFLALCGIEAFEGIVQAAPPTQSEPAVLDLLRRITELAVHCERHGWFRKRPILSAGGSAFFDLAAAVLKQAGLNETFDVILRSGCYLIHDSGFYRRLVERLLVRSPEAAALAGGLEPALELWAYIHSRPEARRVIAGFGKRDTSFDAGFPVPEKWFRPGAGHQPSPLGPGHETVRLDDQHAYLHVPADTPLQVGDMVSFGICHPCTTFDRWSVLYLVDDRYRVTGAIRTFF